ncbi:F-box domain containing protein [Pandoravirus salinus]|uniref:F-box domain containing protein n=1 Tax=Pandoravirus salinus TaxID=1349410 RepID=A0A291ATT3_9VIRU|nr:F-box domain [Pandoravirus salinus]ATE82235.1 F-box domain containing protein [Pandoravirus salinus]
MLYLFLFSVDSCAPPSEGGHCNWHPTAQTLWTPKEKHKQKNKRRAENSQKPPPPAREKMAGIDNLPDELLVAVVREIEAVERHKSVALRLVSSRWRSIVDDARGPPVDPWVLGRCVEFLVQRGRAPTSPQARYEPFSAPWSVVRVAQEVGCGADMLCGPLARADMDAPTYADTVGDWPFDLYSCIADVDPRHTPVDGDRSPHWHAQWARLAAAERCLGCQAPTRGPRDFGRYCDACFLWRPRDDRHSVTGDHVWLFGQHQDAFLDDADDDTCPGSRWKWLGRLARCYQAAVGSGRCETLFRQPCGYIIKEALNAPDETFVYCHRIGLGTFTLRDCLPLYYEVDNPKPLDVVASPPTFALDDNRHRGSRWAVSSLVPTTMAVPLDALD